MSQIKAGRQDTRRSHQNLLPTDANGQWLCQTFNYSWCFLYADAVDPSRKINWETVSRYPLRPRALWERWNDPEQLIGVRFDHTTRYGLLDIDRGSSYLNRESITEIKIALETIGICRILPTQSSWSGGLHLYLPLPEAVSTFNLACALKYCLEAHGFDLKAGQLEILPNIKTWGNHHQGQFTHYQGHRLPLQPNSGSRLLDADLNSQPYGDSLSQLRHQWEQTAHCQDMELLTRALSKGRQHQSKRQRKRSATRTKLSEWQADLESEIRDGWSGPSQTNALLQSISCYGVVFEGLSGDELADYIERIATSRPGYQRWCRHQHEIKIRAHAWARAAENYYWPIGHHPKRTHDLHHPTGKNNIVNFNDQRAKDAHIRIQTAVATLSQSHQLPESVTARAALLTQQANTSRKTLYKPDNLPLWHPHHRPDSDTPTEATAALSNPPPQRCKPPEPISDSAILESHPTPPPEPPEQPNIKKLHTKSPNMKCRESSAEASPEKENSSPEIG